MRRFEVGELDCDVAVHDTVAQHIHGAALVEFGCESLHEPGLRSVGIAAVSGVQQPLPLFWLGSPDEHEQISGVYARHGVEVPRAVPNVSDLHLPVTAVFNQPGGDVFFKRRFSYRHHRHLPLGLNAPHTLEASEMNCDSEALDLRKGGRVTTASGAASWRTNNERQRSIRRWRSSRL